MTSKNLSLPKIPLFFVATGDCHNSVMESILPISLIFTGSYTIAVVNGAKTRKTLKEKESFSEVFREIDQKRLTWNSPLEAITHTLNK